MTFARHRQNERMDDPALDPRLHQQALAGLRRINRWSRSFTAIWHSIRTYLAQRGLDHFRLLDLACGSGDVSVALVRQALAAGFRAELTACDKSPVAIAAAREHAIRTLGNSNHRITFLELDVLHDSLPRDHDIVMTSLFLHHLDENDAVKLLEHMRLATNDLVLVDDLRRSRLGYWLAWWGSRLLSRSAIVHFDGPVSVRGAFTQSEAIAMAEQAGMHGARIRSHWPQRLLLEWRHGT